MTGSNLPPGVSEGMIPGNRPEDAAEDEFWNALEVGLKEKHNLDVEDEYWEADWFQVAIREARDLGYIAGTNDARMEADMAAHIEDQELEHRKTR